MKRINAVLLILLLSAVCASSAARADEGADGKIVVGVMPFAGDGGKEGDAKTDTRGVIAREVFLQVLANSRKIAALRQDIIDRAVEDLHADASALADVNAAVEIGRSAGAQYMLLGKVGNVSQKNRTRETGFLFTKGRETTLSASAELNVQVIDVNAGKIVMNLTGFGSASEVHAAKMGIGLPLGGLVGGIARAAELAGNIKAHNMKTESANEAAVADAAFDLANKVKGELTGEYLYVRAAQDKDNIEINADSSAGVNEKDLYLVYLDGAEKRDKNGVFLEREKLPVAVVEVDRIHRGYSVAKLTPSGGNADLIQTGDKAEPISRTRSRSLVTEKKFIKERPKTPGGAYAALLGSNGGPASASPQETPSSPVSGGADGAESAAPAVTQTPATAALQSQKAPAAPARPSRPPENKSTDPAKVVATYSLPSGEANTRRIAHLNANKLKGQKAYDKYVELASSYGGDYLAAYQAGRLAQQLKKNGDAKAWYDKALAINPNYEPAQNARKKMK
jgi:curli biogenesis system outer membrane secretion channel CsgG